MPKGKPIEGVPRGIRFPEELMPRIQQVATAYRNTFSGAVIYLVELGLKQEELSETHRQIGKDVSEAGSSAGTASIPRRRSAR
jgi:hypothetical protein